MNIWTFMKNKITKLMIQHTSVTCLVLQNIFILTLPAYILREWSCMHRKYSEVLILPDSAVLLGWDLQCWMAQWLVHWGALLGFQEAKPLFRPIVLAQAVSSLPVEPYDAVHSLKKSLMKQARYTRQLVAFLNSFLYVHLFITNIEFLQWIFQYQVNALSINEFNLEFLFEW